MSAASMSSAGRSQTPKNRSLRQPAFDCDEAIGIAAQRVAVRVTLFLAPDESPNLVALAGWRRVKGCVVGTTRMKVSRLRDVNRRPGVALRRSALRKARNV